jgi:hypothetical protein
MTLARPHHALTALLLATAAAHATGPAPGTSDAEVVRWIVDDLVADPRSALTFNGQGVRFVNQPGGGGILTPPAPVPVPLPWAGLMLAGAIGALAMISKGWK